MTLADNFCNGIPLGHTIDGVQTNGAPLTTQQVYDSASAHLDTAHRVCVKGTDAGSIYVLRAAQVFKARVLIDKGQFAAARRRRRRGPDDVHLRHDVLELDERERPLDAEQLGGACQRRRQLRRRRRSVDHHQERAAVRVGERSARAGLARIGAQARRLPPEDGITTPLWLGQLYKNQYRSDGAGVRCRRAACTKPKRSSQANDIAGMMTILNALRAASPTHRRHARSRSCRAIATTPATKDAATDLLFREKAFWTFGRGQRLARSPPPGSPVRSHGRPGLPDGPVLQGRQLRHGRELPGAELRSRSIRCSTACLDRKA